MDMVYGRGGMARARSEYVAEPTTVTAGEIVVRQSVMARWRFVPGGR